MTRDDFTILWKMLTGLWPRLDTDETVAAWHGLLGNYPAHHATAAVRKWATERRAAPTPADIIDGIKAIAAEQRRDRPRAIGSAPCDECDDTGFVWVDFHGHSTVRRCRRGCLPRTEPDTTHGPTPTRHEPGTWVARLDSIRRTNTAQRESMGEAEYLRHRGFDPARYRISHGMIVARPTA